MRSNGTQARRLIRNGWSPAWSADGKKIVFVRDVDGNPKTWDPAIYTMNADGTRLRRLTNGKSSVSGPSWSPNGKKIAFGRQETNGEAAIYTMSSDGTHQRRLSSGAEPAWSPDGKRIGYTAGSPAHIFTINPNGTGRRQLTSDENREDNHPGWSPNGKKIVFTSAPIHAVSSGWRLFEMNSNGTASHKLGKIGGPAYDPAWSPDGKKIVFWRVGKNGPLGIFTANADGSGLHRLTGVKNRIQPDFAPDWQPR